MRTIDNSSESVIDIRGLSRHRQSQLPFDMVSMPRQVVSITNEVNELLAGDAVCAIGVSGGRDSQACAIAVHRHLEKIGHRGPRVMVHADLGVDWTDSLPVCQRLAAHLGWELIVVGQKGKGLMERWEQRWVNNVSRYRDLSCVKLILPWSTPKMRFCTSEKKVVPICSALRKRFPGQPIVNVAGIRRQESAARGRMPVSASNEKLARRNAPGVTWNAIIDWSGQDVMDAIAAEGLALHEAYTRYGSSRVSCAFCIMGSSADLKASTRCADNQDIYRRMVELEAVSTFGFQGSRWLADVAPELLPVDLIRRVDVAKRAAAVREEIESALPEHLLFVRGWPVTMPTAEEAQLIAEVRRGVATTVNLNVECVTADAVLVRYSFLLDEQARKEKRP